MPDTPEVFLGQQAVSPITSGIQDELHITELGDGRILMTWRSDNDTGAGGASGTDIIGRIFNVLGEPIGSEFTLNTYYTIGDQDHHSIVASDNGGWLVVLETGGANPSINIEAHDSTGALTDVSVIQSDGVAAFPNYSNPQIAYSSATSAMVAYEYEVAAAGTNSITYRIYNPTAETTGAQLVLFTTSGAFGLNYSSVQIVALENGNYASIAQFHNSTIQMRIVDASGGNVLSQTAVGNTATNGETDINAQITALTGGGYVVTWQNDTSESDVSFQIYSETGAAVGLMGTISTSSTNENTEPQVAALDDGGFVLFWNNLDDDALRMQRFDASGSPVGTEITVLNDSNVANVETIEVLSDGRFIVGYTGILGEHQFQIYDPRDAFSQNQVKDVIGTIGDDLIVFDDLPSTTPPALFDGIEIFGYDGNDTIDLTGSSPFTGFLPSSLNHIDGGDGTDTVIIDNFYEIIEGINVGATADLSTGEIRGTVLMSNIENLTGSLFDDTLIGDAEANTLIGRAGDDSLDGGAGNDVLRGGAGEDTLVAGAGVDELRGGINSDLLTLRDLASGSVGTGTIFDGDGGTDTFLVDGIVSGSFAVDLSNYTIYSLEELHYRAVAITMTASLLLSFDVVRGIGVVDADYSQNGSISASLGSLQNADFSRGMFFGYNNLNILGNNQNNIITAFVSDIGEDGVQQLFGGGGADTITGSDGYDYIGGGSGSDVIYGLDGGDTLLGAGGHDLIYGGDGADTIETGNGNDTVFGGNHSDLITITSGSATIDGGNGNDTINFNLDVTELLNNVRTYEISGGGDLDLLDFQAFQAAITLEVDKGVGSIATDGSSDATSDPSDEIFEFDQIEFIAGSNHNDYLNALGGDDTGMITNVAGFGGDDLIIAGTQTRWIYGDNGDDTLDGAGLLESSSVALQGFIDLEGGTGSDSIVGSALWDVIVGGLGLGNSSSDPSAPDNDTIYGGAGADRIYGDHVSVSTITFFEYLSSPNPFDPNEDPHYENSLGGGDDVIYGGDGADRIFGDAGNDYIVGGPETWSGVEPDTDLLLGGRGDDTLLGGGDNDTLMGNLGDDSLLGGTGADFMIGGAGGDTMDGGDGIDSLIYADSFGGDTIGVTVDIGAGTGSRGYANGDVFSDIEIVVGSRFNDIIVDGDTDMLIQGGNGRDVLTDALGNDTIEGGYGNDQIIAFKGQNVFSGGEGIDLLSYYRAANGVEVNLETNVTGGAWAATDLISGFENVYGSNKGGDILVGSSTANSIRGYGGRDEVWDGAGDDEVRLGNGNDTMRAGAGDDDYRGGNGRDLVDFGAGFGAVIVDLQAETADTGAQGTKIVRAFEDVIGTIEDDTISGTSSSNDIRAGRGHDSIAGRGGADGLFGANGNDTISGGGGTDIIEGGRGLDVINGNAGNDILSGGDDNDTFVFIAGDGVDTITDWDIGGDTLIFEGFAGQTSTDLLAMAVDVGNDVLFDFGANGGMLVEDVTKLEIESHISVA